MCDSLKYVDVMVYKWLVKNMIEDRDFYYETLFKISNKVIKYEKIYSNNQYNFITFVFDIFDFLTLKNVTTKYSKDYA
jgi:hypothetical protein